MTQLCRPAAVPRTARRMPRRALLRLAGAVLSFLFISACTVTVPPSLKRSLGINGAPPENARLDHYKKRVARRIAAANPGWISGGHPQAMLRSVVVLSFEVDREGHVLHPAIYRTNGDDTVERTALATLRHAAPLPVPPAALLTRAGHAELLEGWLFNDDGRFQLRSIAASQAEGEE